MMTRQRPRLMGILNVTPDSFSDGGEFADPATAVAHGLRMTAEGAELIDVGGESTRPGARRVSIDEQIRRVIPVITSLRHSLPANVVISIDTTQAAVADAAVEAGAGMINDVSAGREDPSIFDCARRHRLPLVLMHMQGTPETMQDDPRYTDAVAEVRDFLVERATAAEQAGVPRAQLVIDPGIGFGKSRLHNLQLIGGLAALVDTGYAVMLGASRKRFMGSICNVTSYNELVGATCATTAFGVLAGVRYLRVHDVKPNRQALDVAWALRESSNDKL
jgi:dihydropteroate synthase